MVLPQKSRMATSSQSEDCEIRDIVGVMTMDRRQSGHQNLAKSLFLICSPMMSCSQLIALIQLLESKHAFEAIEEVPEDDDETHPQ